jgi:hypothetical protein
MVKCAKGQVRRLKTAPPWKIPQEQRRRIQMVLPARERDDGAIDRSGDGRVAEHGEPGAHDL